MAGRQSKTKSGGKRSNGQGESITVFFDIHDRQERRAQQMSKLLAAKAGRRKDVIVTLLASLYDHFEATGEVLTPAELAAMLAKAQMPSAPPMGFTQAVSRQQVQPTPAPNYSRNRHVEYEDKPLVEVASDGKTSAKAIGRAFVSSAGAAFFD